MYMSMVGENFTILESEKPKIVAAWQDLAESNELLGVYDSVEGYLESFGYDFETDDDGNLSYFSAQSLREMQDFDEMRNWHALMIAASTHIKTPGALKFKGDDQKFAWVFAGGFFECSENEIDAVLKEKLASWREMKKIEDNLVAAPKSKIIKL